MSKFFSPLSGVLIALLLSGIMGCAHQDPYQQNNWRQQGYEREKSLMEQQMAAKTITVAQAHHQMVSTSKTYFPNDQLLIQLWEDLAVLAERVDKQELQMDEFLKLAEMRWRLFEDANAQRHKESQYLEAQQRRSDFMGNFLGGMARSMQRNYPQPITCQSTSMPGVVTTNCQ
jgi:hypothetical protein